MLSFDYPPLESFLTGQLDPNDCGCKMATVRAGRGKKKSTRAEPECYGTNCGQKSRDSLERLHKAVT
jgi:hypothetical protein